MLKMLEKSLAKIQVNQWAISNSDLGSFNYFSGKPYFGQGTNGYHVQDLPEEISSTIVKSILLTFNTGAGSVIDGAVFLSSQEYQSYKTLEKQNIIHRSQGTSYASRIVDTSAMIDAAQKLFHKKLCDQIHKLTGTLPIVKIYQTDKFAIYSGW